MLEPGVFVPDVSTEAFPGKLPLSVIRLFWVGEIFSFGPERPFKVPGLANSVSG